MTRKGTINRANWKLTRQYLAYKRDVERCEVGSITTMRNNLNHALYWLMEMDVTACHTHAPPFAEWLAERTSSRGEPFAHETMRRILSTFRTFIEWCKDEDTKSFRHIKKSYLASLKPISRQSRPKTVEYVTESDIMAISTLPTPTLDHARAKIACIFLYLSGMRITAYSTLPLHAVDLATHTVEQWEAHGVKAKNRKSATTTLLPIPHLITHLQDWHTEMKRLVNPHWYPIMDSKTGEWAEIQSTPGDNRDGNIRNSIKTFLTVNGMAYHPPHNFRDGHTIWLMRRATTLVQLKAISENLMHSSMKTTDEYYGRLTQHDRHNAIMGIGGRSTIEMELEAAIRRILETQKSP